MNTSNLEEKITSNYLINKNIQIYLTCKQIEILNKFNFKYKNHNIFYNHDLKIYTAIENCYSFNNDINHKTIQIMNNLIYSEYIQIDNTQNRKILNIFLKNIIKEQ